MSLFYLETCTPPEGNPQKLRLSFVRTGTAQTISDKLYILTFPNKIPTKFPTKNPTNFHGGPFSDGPKTRVQCRIAEVASAKVVVGFPSYREETKVRFCKRTVLANVPSFRAFGAHKYPTIIAFFCRVALQGKTF